MRVELRLNRPKGKSWNKQKFDKISQDKRSIQEDLEQDEKLEWERMDDKQTSRIALYRSGSIFDDESTLVEIHKWFVKNLIDFKKAFDPYLDN